MLDSLLAEAKPIQSHTGGTCGDITLLREEARFAFSKMYCSDVSRGKSFLTQ